jgi:hypothetical protein
VHTCTAVMMMIYQHTKCHNGNAVVFDFSHCKIRGPRSLLVSQREGRLSFLIFIAIQIIQFKLNSRGN